MNGSVELLLSSGVLLMTPILLAALGEIVIERSGVLNVGIEGVMLFGCFGAGAVLELGGPLALAVVAAAAGGSLLGGALAFFFVRRRVSQIVGGILFNVLALGVTTMIFARTFDGSAATAVADRVAIPLLADLPLVGRALFDQPLLVYLALAAAPAMAWVLGGTWFGLHVRAAGNGPEAVDSAGISVGFVRTAALVLGCSLIALGGACIIALQAGVFSPGMTEGLGFIALAIAMLARWRPLWAILAAAAFGLAQSLQFQTQSLGLDAIPPQFAAMAPYLVTIAALALGTAARYPTAIAVPYVRDGAR